MKIADDYLFHRIVEALAELENASDTIEADRAAKRVVTAAMKLRARVSYGANLEFVAAHVVSDEVK